MLIFLESFSNKILIRILPEIHALYALHHRLKNNTDFIGLTRVIKHSGKISFREKRPTTKEKKPLCKQQMSPSSLRNHQCLNKSR